MKESQRMQKIADINKVFETAAGAAYANAQAHFDSQQEQLYQLQAYRDEYRQRLKEITASGISPTAMKDYRYFFASLDHAIKAQEDVIDKLNNKMTTSRSEWLSKRQETEKMDLISAKIRNKERKKHDLKEQKEADDLSQVLFNFHKNSTPQRTM